jgi:ATP-binding cassette subfamily B protein
VDLRTEASIIAAMEQLMRGRTTFIIAHRLDTLEGCDLLLHLEDGRVRPIEPSALRAAATGA